MPSNSAVHVKIMYINHDNSQKSYFGQKYIFKLVCHKYY